MAHGRLREIRLWVESFGFLMLLILLLPVGMGDLERFPGSFQG